MESIKSHPISLVQWVDVDGLSANDYNPNFVFGPEFTLLETSILRNGWIQPILITAEHIIIDGFHRATLAKKSKRVRDLTGGKVPVCILNIEEHERLMLTVRINRAKGQHTALKMSKLIHRLVNEMKCSIDEVMAGIGATRQEVELLLQDGVFKALKIDEHKYSKAWVPK